MRNRRLWQGESNLAYINATTPRTDLNDPLLACNQQFLDLCSNPPVFGFDGAFEYSYRLSRFVEEILVKIPARRAHGRAGWRLLRRRTSSRTSGTSRRSSTGRTERFACS